MPDAIRRRLGSPLGGGRRTLRSVRLTRPVRLRRAELDEALHAGGAQGEQRLAPAHGAQQVLGSSRRTSTNGAALPLE
jgi:hypothetical protein